jgi:hypothetical protein
MLLRHVTATLGRPTALRYADGSVQLADGTRLRALEVIPTHLPYKSSEFVSEPAHRKRAITGVILTTQENEG